MLEDQNQLKPKYTQKIQGPKSTKSIVLHMKTFSIQQQASEID